MLLKWLLLYRLRAVSLFLQIYSRFARRTTEKRETARSLLTTRQQAESQISTTDLECNNSYEFIQCNSLNENREGEVVTSRCHGSKICGSQQTVVL